MEPKALSVRQLVLLALICVIGVFWLSTTRVNAPISSPVGISTDDWLTYTDPDLGVSFRYPPEWGEVSDRIKVLQGVDIGETISARFSGNPNIFLDAREKNNILLDHVDVRNLKDSCRKPKILKIMSEGLSKAEGYCRLYEDGGRYLYEAVVAYDSSRRNTYDDVLLRAILSLDHSPFSQFELTQYIKDTDPASILNRTADPAILEKIDTFEKVMMTLEIR